MNITKRIKDRKLLKSIKNNVERFDNLLEDVQEDRDYSREQVIEFANVERVAVTGIREEIKTLEESEEFLLSLGYAVEEM